MAKKAVFFRTGFNYDGDEVSVETGLLCEDESLTVQSEADDADINTIVRRFGLTGMVPQNVRAPLATDFVDIVDFKDAMNAVVAAQASFAQMPWEIRDEFRNDPERFVRFCTETGEDGKLKNLERMRELGLALPAKADPPAPEPMLVRVVEDKPKDAK